MLALVIGYRSVLGIGSLHFCAYSMGFMYIGVEELMKPESEVRLDYLLNKKNNN